MLICDACIRFGDLVTKGATAPVSAAGGEGCGVHALLLERVLSPCSSKPGSLGIACVDVPGSLCGAEPPEFE